MNNKFDELAKGLAQSVTRRQALKRFGTGLAGMALACFGLAVRVSGISYAGRRPSPAKTRTGKCLAFPVTSTFGSVQYIYKGGCIDPNTCQSGSSPDCPEGKNVTSVFQTSCGDPVGPKSCSF